MRALCTVLLCLVLIIAIPCGVKMAQGYYFDLHKVVQGIVPLVKAFPALEVDNQAGIGGVIISFADYSASLFKWCALFVSVLLAIDPWVEGTPRYRDDLPAYWPGSAQKGSDT